MSHVRYIDKTREYYLGQGYEKPYEWAHFDEVPFFLIEQTSVGGTGLFGVDLGYYGTRRER